MDGLSGAPSWVGELAGGLVSMGFEQIEERRYGESFGDYLATFARRRLRVRAVKDRWEWRVDLWDAEHPRTKVGHERLTSVSLLRGVLDGVTDEENVHRWGLDDEVEWLLSHLDAAERAVTDPATWAVLEEYKRQYGKRAFGVDFT